VIAGLALAATVAAAPAASDGSAGRRYPVATCSVDPATATLSVDGANTRIVLKRAGSGIVVSQPGIGPRACTGGVPTVTSIDTIAISGSTGASFSIDLRGGPFVPGAEVEGDGSSEIEFTADLEAADVEVRGTGAAEVITAGQTPGGPAVDLNADEAEPDADLTFTGSGASLSIAGKGGADSIAGDGGSGFTRGFRGDFEAAAGAGADLLVGTTGGDALKAGGGADTLRGLGGGDSIYARDSTVDRIACGPGSDLATVDREDRARGCERVSHV
jgi:Ca2+-binding RTX toxin-like protein